MTVRHSIESLMIFLFKAGIFRITMVRGGMLQNGMGFAMTEIGARLKRRKKNAPIKEIGIFQTRLTTA